MDRELEFSIWKHSDVWTKTRNLIIRTEYWNANVTHEMIENVENIGARLLKTLALQRMWDAWKDNVAMSHDRVLSFDRRCARCRLKIREGREVGGEFDGVICPMHKACMRCWFRSKSDYGVRKFENQASKNIKMTDGPRSSDSVRCFGCAYKVPYHVAGANQFCKKYFKPNEFRREFGLRASVPHNAEVLELDDDD